VGFQATARRISGSAAGQGAARPDELQALALLTGRERIEAEYRALFEASGFRLRHASDVAGKAMLEGTPV
jgi:hypothetical protein